MRKAALSISHFAYSVKTICGVRHQEREAETVGKPRAEGTLAHRPPCTHGGHKPSWPTLLRCRPKGARPQRYSKVDDTGTLEKRRAKQSGGRGRERGSGEEGPRLPLRAPGWPASSLRVPLSSLDVFGVCMSKDHLHQPYSIRPTKRPQQRLSEAATLKTRKHRAHTDAHAPPKKERNMRTKRTTKMDVTERGRKKGVLKRRRGLPPRASLKGGEGSASLPCPSPGRG